MLRWIEKAIIWAQGPIQAPEEQVPPLRVDTRKFEAAAASAAAQAEDLGRNIDLLAKEVDALSAEVKLRQEIEALRVASEKKPSDPEARQKKLAAARAKRQAAKAALETTEVPDAGAVVSTGAEASV